MALNPLNISTLEQLALKGINNIFAAADGDCSMRECTCTLYRYDLGSGRKILRSREPITLGRFHRLSAKRYGRACVLRLDGGRDVSGVSPGNLRSLNIGMSLYLGSVANITDRYIA